MAICFVGLRFWRENVSKYIQYLMILAVVEVLAWGMCRGEESLKQVYRCCLSQIANTSGFVGSIVTTTTEAAIKNM